MRTYKGSDTVFNVIVIGIVTMIVLIIVLPLFHVVASSFSSTTEVAKGNVGLIPREFTLSGYLAILSNESIRTGFMNSIIYTVLGTIIQVTLQFTAAYPLARKDFKAAKVINIFLIITMFVSGGIIPTYIVVNSLGLINTIWAMIIPGCVSIFNIMIIRTYIIHSIPKEVQDAATIDGCGDFALFWRIILPLCKPVLMIMILYAVVGYWNSYFNSLLYLTDESLYPLQRIVQNLLINNDNSGLGSGEAIVLSEQLKYVSIVVTALPLLVVFPFFQKHFEKGVMIGGVKG